MSSGLEADFHGVAIDIPLRAVQERLQSRNNSIDGVNIKYLIKN